MWWTIVHFALWALLITASILLVSRGGEVILSFVVKNHLVFKNEPEVEDQQGFFTHVLVKSNEAVLFVRGSQGDKGGTFIKAAVNSPEIKTRGEISPNCHVEDFDLVPRESRLNPETGVMEVESDAMGRWEKAVYEKTGLRFKGRTFWDIFFASVYRYRFPYTKEMEVQDEGRTPVIKLVPRNQMTYRFLLEEQTHPFEVMSIDVSGKEGDEESEKEGIRKRITVNLKGHFTFKIVNLYKPTQIAGQYVVKVREQISNLARQMIQRWTIDDLLIGTDKGGTEAKDIREDIGQRLAKVNEELVGQESKRGTKDTWGIEIVRVTVEDLEFDKTVLEVLRKQFVADEEAKAYEISRLRRANADKQARLREGEGEEGYLVSVGEGEKKKREALGIGDALAIKALKGEGRVSQEDANALVATRLKTEAIKDSRAATVVMDTQAPGLMLNVTGNDNHGETKQKEGA